MHIQWNETQSEMKWALCGHFQTDAQLNQAVNRWDSTSQSTCQSVTLHNTKALSSPPLSGMTPFLTVWVRRRTVKRVVDLCWMIRLHQKMTSIHRVSSRLIITSVGWWAGEFWEHRWRKIRTSPVTTIELASFDVPFFLTLKVISKVRRGCLSKHWRQLPLLVIGNYLKDLYPTFLLYFNVCVVKCTRQWS